MRVLDVQLRPGRPEAGAATSESSDLVEGFAQFLGRERPDEPLFCLDLLALAAIDEHDPASLRQLMAEGDREAFAGKVAICRVDDDNIWLQFSSELEAHRLRARERDAYAVLLILCQTFS